MSSAKIGVAITPISTATINDFLMLRSPGLKENARALGLVPAEKGRSIKGLGSLQTFGQEVDLHSLLGDVIASRDALDACDTPVIAVVNRVGLPVGERWLGKHASLHWHVLLDHNHLSADGL